MNKKGRSPAYPAIDLKAAIDRARELYEKEKNGFVPYETVLIDWGFKSKTGVGAVTIAALNYYGLLENQGTGKQRRIGLSSLALKILRDEKPDSQERLQALREAALKPKVFAELWNRYPGGRVSDETLRTDLKIEMGFLDDAAKGVVKNFRKVIDYARLEGQNNVGPTEYLDLGTSRMEDTMSTVQERIEAQDTDSIKTYFLELPYRLKDKTTKFSVKIPFPIEWSDWERMKGLLDIMFGELLPGKPDEKKT